MLFKNICAHCGEGIFRYGTKDPWMHQRTESAWCGWNNIAEPDEGLYLKTETHNSNLGQITHLGRRET